MAERTSSQNAAAASLLAQGPAEILFPPHLALVPQIHEVYELELAYLESRLLSDTELVRNSGFFARVGERLTWYYLMCSGEPVRLPSYSSSRLKAFFTKNQFKTGYATHGLFPYRGKFHPQMVRGLLNAMDLKPGDTVLDPMMGSGTVLVEAALMGIRSIGVDASEFCRLITQAKLDGLTIPLAPVRAALKDARSVFGRFRSAAANDQPNQAGAGNPQVANVQAALANVAVGQAGPLDALPKGCEAEAVRRFLLLAYLDSAGYAQRSDCRSPFDQFYAILERYLCAAEKIQSVLLGVESELGEAKPLVGDARKLPLDDGSVDGILFSPPYSFAIDYLENDASHLKYLGVNVGDLRGRMIGLRGRTLLDKVELYKTDMSRVLSECSRVMRPGRFCTIIVGTNSNQLSRALRVPESDVQGLDEMLAAAASGRGLRLVRKMSRQISGIANTMRTEHILIMQRA